MNELILDLHRKRTSFEIEFRRKVVFCFYLNLYSQILVFMLKLNEALAIRFSKGALFVGKSLFDKGFRDLNKV